MTTVPITGVVVLVCALLIVGLALLTAKPKEILGAAILGAVICAIITSGAIDVPPPPVTSSSEVSE